MAMRFPDLSGLNPEQREAVETLSGPLLVLAGAGTGKTKVITTRIAQLVAHGTPPSQILAVTFTNKAAKEMRERIARLVSAGAAEELTIGTFHSFCLLILRQHSQRLGYYSGFSISDDSYQADLLRNLIAEHGWNGDGVNPPLWLSLISKAKCQRIGPEGFADWCTHPRRLEIAQAYAAYQRRMKQMQLIDFDDILCLVLELWEKHPSILEAHREHYQHLLVDEYQDTNGIQFQIVATLAAPRNNLCVVGDDDQSIYGWRGADVGNILSFDQQFPGAKVIRLERNYRSTSTILEAANQVIACNRSRHPKKLWTPVGSGEKLLMVRCPDAEKEAEFATHYIKEKLRAFNNDYGQFAILFRSNHQSRLLEQAFRRARIPYSLIGTSSFFKRKEIQDVLSMLQLIANPRDDLSLLRIVNVPPRGLGDKAMERLLQLSHAIGKPMRELLLSESFLDELPGKTAEGVRRFCQVLDQYSAAFRQPGGLANKIQGLIREIGYLEAMPTMYTPRENALQRIDNVNEFISYVADYESKAARPSLKDLLDAFTLLDAASQDEHGKEAAQGKVSLVTVHSAKGLEYPAVIVVGLERDLFPNARAVEEGSLEEERRLFYVAITRARQECVLTHAELRTLRGHPTRQRASRFLDEIPEELCKICTPEKAFPPASKEDLERIYQETMARLRG